MIHRRDIRGFVLIVSLGWSLMATSEARAVGRCLPKTVAAIGKLEAELLACRAEIAATNDSSGAVSCDSAATTRFLSRLGRAGDCGGDPGVAEAVAVWCADRVSEAMTDAFPSRCEAAKRKAAGKLASREIRCYARAWRDCTVVVDATCLGRARKAFTIALTRAGSCPDRTFPLETPPLDDVEGVCVNPATALHQHEIAPVCYPPCDGSTPQQLCGATCAPTCVNEGDSCCQDQSSGFFFCCAGNCVYDYEAQRSSCSGCGDVGDVCCPGNVCFGSNCCGGYCSSGACGLF